MDAAARYVALLHDLRVARENQDEERIGMLEDALDALWYRMDRDERKIATTTLCVLYRAESVPVRANNREEDRC